MSPSPFPTPKRAAALTLWGAVALFALAPAAARAADARITSIQVVQSIQGGGVDPTNVRLVADKSTAIRAVVDVVDGPIAPFSGRAHVAVDGVAVTPPAGIAPINAPFTPKANPSLDNENDTLNFELPAPTGITPRNDPFSSNNVTVRVDIFPVGDSDLSNNSRTVRNLRVRSKDVPRVRWQRIRYTPFSNTLPTLSRVQRGTGDLFMRSALPFNDGRAATLYANGDSPRNYGNDFDGDDRLDAAAAGGPPEGDILLLELELQRLVLAASESLPGDRTHFVGWLRRGSLDDHNGLGSLGGRVAYTFDGDGSQSTLGHEITHNLGLVQGTSDGHNEDNETIGPAVGWDTLGRLAGSLANNGFSGRVQPSTQNDIVNPSNPGPGRRWPRIATYNDALDALPDRTSRLFGVRGGDPPVAEQPFCARNRATIVGRLNFNPRAAQLRPTSVVDLSAFRASWCNASEPAASSATARAAHEGHAGLHGTALARTRPLRVRMTIRPPRGALRTFTVPVEARTIVNLHDEEAAGVRGRNPIGLGPFVVTAPIAGELVALELSDARGRRLASLRAPSRALGLRITAPRRGATLSGSESVTWQVTGVAAAERARLRYLVAYSRDGGREWEPIAVNLREPRVAVDARLLERSTRGVIRVLASDGVRSAFADVTALRTSGRNADREAEDRASPPRDEQAPSAPAPGTTPTPGTGPVTPAPGTAPSLTPRG